VTQRQILTLAGMAIAVITLAGCSGNTVAGNPTPNSGSTPSTSAPSSSSAEDAPSVQNPLPAKVLDGSPCDTALTTADVTKFIGNSTPAKPDEDPTGNICFWHNLAGDNASLGVTYQTKADGALRLAYKNVKPSAARWDVLQPIQGYPAVGYLAAGDDPANKSQCHVVVGISDHLAYSVDMTLSDTATQKGIDPCDAGRNVADQVLTNIKART
jgi:hypothetical protein